MHESKSSTEIVIHTFNQKALAKTAANILVIYVYTYADQFLRESVQKALSLSGHMYSPGRDKCESMLACLL